MKSKGLAGFVFTALISLFIGGCINYEQETYLNEDLSGRVEICVFPNPKPLVKSTIQKIGAETEIEKMIAGAIENAAVNIKMEMKEEDFLNMFNASAVKNKKYKKITRDGVPYFYFTVEFDDIRKLYEGKKAAAVSEDKYGLLAYTEYFTSLEDNKKAEGGGKGDPDFFKGCHFRYILHMPRDIVKANTDRIDKNTAVWELPIDKVVNNRDFCVMAEMKGQNRFTRLIKKYLNK